MKRQISNTTPRRLRTALTRLSLWTLALPVLFVVCEPGQAQNVTVINSLPSSVDFAVGRTSRFRLSDFRHEAEDGSDYPQPDFILPNLPADGTLRIKGAIAQGGQNTFVSLFRVEFASSEGITYTPPADATVGSDYARFVFGAEAQGTRLGTTATMTINLVANSAPDFGDAMVGTRIWPPGTTVPLVLPATTGGNGAITYAITPDLPDGLAFDADTRTISGAPTTASAMIRHTLTATDADGETDTLTFGIDPMRPVRLRLRLFLEGPLR